MTPTSDPLVLWNEWGTAPTNNKKRLNQRAKERRVDGLTAPDSNGDQLLSVSGLSLTGESGTAVTPSESAPLTAAHDDGARATSHTAGCHRRRTERTRCAGRHSEQHHGQRGLYSYTS